ncbi:alkene reductase, partial [Streptomyces vinaceus]
AHLTPQHHPTPPPGPRHRPGARGAGATRTAVAGRPPPLDAIGATRTGIRLSPGGTFWGVAETEVPELYAALLAELARLGLAYVHLEATSDEHVLLGLRRAWPGTLIVNPTLPMGPKQTGRADADHWLGLGADLISFGRAYIANPDLVERLRLGLPVAPMDEATLYQGGDAGYLTYTAYQHAG